MSSKTLHKSIAYVKAKRPVHSLVPGIAWLCLSFFHHRVTVSLHPLLDVLLLSHNLDLWLWLSQPSVTELHAACCIQYWLTDWHAACYISDSDLLLIPNSLCDPPARRRHVSKALLSWRMFKSVRRRISSQRNWWSWSTPCKPFTLTVPASVCHNQERGCMSLQWIRSSAKLFTVQISGRLGWRPAHYHGYDMIWYDMIDDDMNNNIIII
jgi:hypothetical protein